MALVSNVLELAGAILLVGVGQGLARPFDQRIALANHAHERAGGRLRDALLGADAGADDQLFRSPTCCSGRVAISAPYWFGFAVYLIALLAAVRFLGHVSTYVSAGRSVGAEVLGQDPDLVASESKS